MHDHPRDEPPLEGITRGEFLKAAGAAGFLITASGSVLAVLGGTAGARPAAATAGRFSRPFVEPVVYYPRYGNDDIREKELKVRTGKKCIRRNTNQENGRIFCKPTAGSVALLPDGRILYWNAIEGSENLDAFLLDNDKGFEDEQSRVLTLNDDNLRNSKWLKPNRATGGVENSPRATPSLDPLVVSDEKYNNGSMFCSHQTHLFNGCVMVIGGSHFLNDPIAEVQGLKNCRIFDAADNTWFQTGKMHYFRWYPASVALADGDVAAFGGVVKLVKPVYPEEPETSGENVLNTEIYNHRNGKWTDLGERGKKSLPLMPRMHLLPNGHVLYNAAGQAFSPFGEASQQATWNNVKYFDPEDTWTEGNFAGFPFTLDEKALTAIVEEFNFQNEETPIELPTGAMAPDTEVGSPEELAEALTTVIVSAPQDPTRLSNAAGTGFRGSTFSVPLLKEPPYDKAEYLTSGGVIAGVLLTNPGTYVATNLSRIDTLTFGGDDIGYESRFTGQLNNRRWFSSGILLPTGEVFACSGGDRDEVIFPGSEMHIKVSEMFDPGTETWTEMDEATQPRTYHNSAVLLPDGRVLVGGHAPLPFGYGSHLNDRQQPPGFGPNTGHDPTFEVYSPPYAFEERPVITNSTEEPRELEIGGSFNIQTPDVANIDSVVLMRLSSVTHVNDCEQLGVKLAFRRRPNRNSLIAQMPNEAGVVPPGAYNLFIVRRDDVLPNGVPSVSTPVMVPVSS